MALFYQQDINDDTRLGIWHITEPEAFFLREVALHRGITHPHKRLQHLAGRWLLRTLFPAFPAELIQIADTRKPFLPDASFHFSISHCGDYAAAIVSRTRRVGIDIEIPQPKIAAIAHKFVNDAEWAGMGRAAQALPDVQALTTVWSAKEAVFKWYGMGEVDFKKHICLTLPPGALPQPGGVLPCDFLRNGRQLLHINYYNFGELLLAWVEC